MRLDNFLSDSVCRRPDCPLDSIGWGVTLGAKTRGPMFDKDDDLEPTD
jgi:hypothetical protein